MTPEHFQTFARYNAWANDRLYAACAQLPDADFRASRQAFFGSILGTLNHILVGDRAWLGRIQDVPSGITQLDETLFDNLADLKQARVAEDERILTLTDTLDAESLDRDVVYRTMAGGAARRWSGCSPTCSTTRPTIRTSPRPVVADQGQSTAAGPDLLSA